MVLPIAPLPDLMRWWQAGHVRGVVIGGLAVALLGRPRVTRDIDPRMHLNTAISALMELVNELYAFGDQRGIRPTGREDQGPPAIPRAQTGAVLREAVEALVLMLSPFAPHMAEELWSRLRPAMGEKGLAEARWPSVDEDAARAEEIEVPVQVNGKVRARLTVSPDATAEELERLALADPAVMTHLAGKTVKKVVVALGRLVSVVAG